MSTILPFEPTLSPVSLRRAYAEDDMQAFVEKLRQLAALTPETCGVLFRLLDQALAGMLDDVAARGSISEPREDQLSSGGYRLTLSHEPMDGMDAALRASKGAPLSCDSATAMRRNLDRLQVLALLEPSLACFVVEWMDRFLTRHGV